MYCALLNLLNNLLLKLPPTHPISCILSTCADILDDYMPAVEQLISEAQMIFVSLYEYEDFKVTLSDF